MSNKTKSLADQLFPIEENVDLVDVLDIPPEKRKLHTETYDFSIATIAEYLKNGHIYVPMFQRGYVWNRGQASRLIESLIIQCPIPVLYFDQSLDSKFSVIDGNQRLTSIRLFLGDEFSLRGLTAYPELDGMFYSDLDPRIQRHIINRTLRCISILPDTHPQIKFDVFERLNTGSVGLTPQELRHGIYHGKLISKIEELAKDAIWKKITRIKTDKRMKRSELVLRFIALSNNLDNYFKPLAGFLNQFCELNKNPSDAVLSEWEDGFAFAVRAINEMYGELAFRPFDENFNPQKAINTALFDAQMIAVHRVKPNIGILSRRDKERLWLKTSQLYKTEEFSKSIGSGTSSKTSVLRRIDLFTKFLNEYSF